MSARHLCPACHSAAHALLPAMLDVTRKLESVLSAADGESTDDELAAILADGERVARALNHTLCEECRKLGPPLPAWLE